MEWGKRAGKRKRRCTFCSAVINYWTGSAHCHVARLRPTATAVQGIESEPEIDRKAKREPVNVTTLPREKEKRSRWNCCHKGAFRNPVAYIYCM